MFWYKAQYTEWYTALLFNKVFNQYLNLLNGIMAKGGI